MKPAAIGVVNSRGANPNRRTSAAPERVSYARFWWLHPFCFALFPVLSLYAANLDEVPWTDVVRPIAVVLLGAVITGAALCGVIRNRQKAALLLSVLLTLFLSYGHIYALGKRLTAYPIVLTLIRDSLAPIRLLFLGIVAFLGAGLILSLLRSRRQFKTLTQLANVVGVILLVQPVYQIAASALRFHGLVGPMRKMVAPADPIAADVRRAAAHPSAWSPPTPQRPDIYYIILDAYGRQDVLQSFYGFDNRPFVRALRQRGFFVASRARPNYGQTTCSLCSSLNMAYLDDLERSMGRDGTSYAPLAQRTDDNAVAKYLRGQQAYKYIAVTTGLDIIRPSHADLILGDERNRIGFRALSAFEVTAMDQTPLALLPQKEKMLFDQHRNQLLQAFADLGRIPTLPYRKFVFAHILAPHPPFVFGPEGQPIQPAHRLYDIGDGSDFMRQGTPVEYARGYIGQLQYTNRLVLQAIDDIRAHSAVPPIIVIQGDHGPRMHVDWLSLAHTDVRETYGNLNGFYLPDGSASRVFYDDITPVNSFRLLFNHEFGTRLSLLPDRSYYSTLTRPYDFIDVTDQIPRTLSGAIIAPPAAAR